MRTEMVIRDVRRTDSLETYLSSQLESVVEALIPEHRNAVLKMSVQEDSHRTNLRRPHFECSVFLKVGRMKPIHIRKQDSDFHACVDKLSMALRETLRRNHKKAAPLHRSKYYREPEDWTTPENQSA